MPLLSPQDIEDLSRLLSETLSADDLEVIVYSSTGDRLHEAYVGDGLPLRNTIYKLLIELEQLGITCKFLSSVYDRRPNRSDVREAIACFCPTGAQPRVGTSAALSLQQGGQPQPDAPPDAFAPGLQRNVRPHLAKIDVRVWLEKFAAIERRVCRIEIAGNALGTGFLVGPQAVLTNWHVVKRAKEGTKLQNIQCHFDYLLLADGSRQQGVSVKLHTDGVLDHSPYSDAETTSTPDQPPPTADELDYALLRLAEPLGEQSIKGCLRGWVELPAAATPISAGMPLLIVQHPDGAPMKLALDTDSVIGRTANGLRIRYKTNTDPGSSGSPCFSMDWDLIALHHYGDPAWQAPQFNQGIPAELIRKRIIDQGHAAAIAA